MVFTIRASSLPSFADCELRWAGENFEVISKAATAANGGESKRVRGIGSIIGISNHFGALAMLKDMRETGKPRLEAGVRNAIAYFTGEMEDRSTVEIDDITKNLDHGVRQITKMMEAFYYTYAIGSAPALLEHELFMPINDYLRVGGKLDNIQENWKVPDYKFGRDLSSYHSQKGAYLALVAYNFAKAMGLQSELIWTPRVGVDVEQPSTKIIPLDYEACTEAFWYQVFAIRDRLQKWHSTKSPKYWFFNRNADSKYCKKKYCRLWGTTICDQWIDLEPTKEVKPWASW